MSVSLPNKDDEGLCIRAALTGEILGRVPCWPATLNKMRELAHEAMKRSVPLYCLDLVQGGMLLKSNSDYARAKGAFVDVVVVRRKVVCEECSERMRCFCGTLRDQDCACAEEVKEVCKWGLWLRYTPLMAGRSTVF